MNNIFTIIKNIEDKNGNLIFQIFVADAFILLIKVISFFVIMYVGKILVGMVDKYIDKISIEKVDAGAKPVSYTHLTLPTKA